MRRIGAVTGEPKQALIELTIGEPTAVEFTDGDSLLRLTLLSWAFPDLQDGWDSMAINATLSLEAGPFRGELPTTVWSPEVAALRDLLVELDQQIGQAIRGHVQLPIERRYRLQEGTLTLLFRVVRGGQIILEIEARDPGWDRKRLMFDLAVQPTPYLNEWIRSLNQAVAHFPAHLG